MHYPPKIKTTMYSIVTTLIKRGVFTIINDQNFGKFI
jgi:hypothetical protein